MEEPSSIIQSLANSAIQEVPTIDEFAAVRISKALEKASKPLTIQGMIDYAKDNGALGLRHTLS